MTKDELARAVVRLPGFAWRGGMVDTYGDRISHIGTDGVLWQADEMQYDPDPAFPPDLDDPATGGVLLEMVPPEWRRLVGYDDRAGGYYAALLRPGQFPKQRPCDSLGHAAAAVLVDCGRCHEG